MSRSNEEVGKLAFALFEELSRVSFTVDEMKNLGEHIWANPPKRGGASLAEEAFKVQSQEMLAKLRPQTIAKLFKVAQALDVRYPAPDPLLPERVRELEVQIAAAGEEAQRALGTANEEIARLRRVADNAAAEGRKRNDEIARLRAELAAAGTPASGSPAVEGSANGAASEEPQS
jgi:hypothetical protein